MAMLKRKSQSHGEALQRMRFALGISQRALAAKLGCSPASLCLIEQGARPNGLAIPRIMKALLAIKAEAKGR